MTTNLFAQEHEFDSASYEKISKEVIADVISGNTDADKLIANCEKLIDIAIEGCEKYKAETDTPEEEKKIMQIVIDNAKSMSSLSLDEIEEQWHDGGYLRSKGIDPEKYDHFSKVFCYVDTVVHPATCVICLKEGESEQVKDELKEVLEHITKLK